MAIIKCKMCGGDVSLAPDKTFGTCEYCGCTMTFPKVSDDQRAAAFNRGNHFRRMGEFDKALSVYERIVAEDDADAEAHWCCALCRFGIEYVEDPVTLEWLPTCHRLSFDSFLEDLDYLAALEHSDGITRRQYQRDAAKIAEVQRGILATSQSAEPYDVFLSYKELDAEGNRTRDSVLAQEIYYQLTEKGWRVFFSRISLEDVPGTQYEPYIFAALNSAKVMVVVGTSAENLNAVWVKNEWSRYLSLMRKDRSRLLVPCYRDMDPYDLPEQLSVLMSYDMGKIGFIQDLIRGIDKVLKAEKPREAAPAPVQERVIVQQPGGGPNVTALLKRGQQALEDGDWDKAGEFFDQVLSMDAENAEAFLGLGLAENRCKDPESYVRMACSGEAVAELVRLRPEREHVESQAAALQMPGRLERKAIESLYDFEESYESRLKSQKNLTRKAREAFEQNRNFMRAFRYARGESRQKLEALKKELFDKLDQRVRAAEISDREALEKAKAELAAKLEDADREAAERCRAAHEMLEADYQAACRQADAAKEDFEFTNAAAAFRKVGQYKDAAELAHDCDQKAAELKARRKQEERIAKEATRRKKGILLGTAAVAVLAVLLLVTKVLLPAKQYKEAEALLEACKYEEAAAAFEELGDYKDALERANAAAYAQAETLEAAGQYQQAAFFYGKAGNYQNARERSFALWEEIAQRETLSAGSGHTVGLRSDGTVLAVGENDYGQCEVSGWTDIVAVSAGSYHTVGLQADGTVLAVGSNAFGRCDVSGWTDIVAVSAGGWHTVGLRSDGTVVAVGRNGDGQCDVSGWTDIVAVSAGSWHTVGLRSDGTVLAMGRNGDGQCDVSGWTDIVAVSAGDYHTVGLRSDGTVLAVGSNAFGRCDVSGWTDIVAVSAGDYHTVGLRSDGTVVATKYTGDQVYNYGNYGQCDVSGWTDIVAVSAGNYHTVGLRSDGTVVAVGYNDYGQCDVSGWTDIALPEKNARG